MGAHPFAMKTVPGNEGYREAPRAVGGEIIPNRGAGWLAGWLAAGGLVVMSYYVGAARGKSRIPATLLD